jgi:hypothetical protein
MYAGVTPVAGHDDDRERQAHGRERSDRASELRADAVNADSQLYVNGGPAGLAGLGHGSPPPR